MTNVIAQSHDISCIHVSLTNSNSIIEAFTFNEQDQFKANALDHT